MIKVGQKYKCTVSGEFVEIQTVVDSTLARIQTIVTAVWYKDNNNYLHVLTITDFLKQYKKVEPVYEYLYAYQLDDNEKGEWRFHPYHFVTVADCMNYATNSAYNFQRLDFTKRERQC